MDSKLPSMLIPEDWHAPGFGVVQSAFDASAKVCLRLSLSSIHDAVTAAPFDHNVHHRGF
jgi:hypothetical protein